MDQQPSPTAADTPPGDRWRRGPADLDVRVDPGELGFRTTAELVPLDHAAGPTGESDALVVAYRDSLRATP